MEPKKFTLEMCGVKYPAEYVKHTDRALETLNEINPEGLLGVDTETMTHIDNKNGALDPHCSQIRLLQLSDGEKVFVYDMKLVDFSVFRTLLLTREFTGHNSIFDLRFFINQFAPKSCIFPMKIHCTLIMSRLLNHAVYSNDFLAGSAGLQNMVKKILDFDISKKLQNSAWGNVDLTFEQVEYAAYDPICALKVYEYLEPRIDKWGMTKVYNLLRTLQHPLAMAELRGIGFNKLKHKSLIRVWAKKLFDARNQLADIIGSNRITGTTIGNYLKENLSPEDLKLWPLTPTGRLKTDAHAMADFSHLDVIKPISEHAKYETLCNNFGVKLQEHLNIKTEKLHTWYTILGARTGRLSCSKPNLQQMPNDKEVRELFIAEEGRTFAVADFSQIEVRVAAEVSQDKNMLHVYREGLDIYKFTASKIFNVALDKVTKEQRQLGKLLVLGLLYGLGAPGFVHYVKKGAGIVVKESEAHKMINAFRETYSGFRDWQLNQAQKSEDTGYAKTLMGKIRKLEPGNTYGAGLNMPIQGTAAEIIFLALNKMWKLIAKERLDCYIILTVHDEIMLDCKTEISDKCCRALETVMVEAFAEVFPKGVTSGLADANCGANWYEAK